MFDQNPLTQIGYALLGFFFVAGGLFHVTHFRQVSEELAKRHIPASSAVLVVGTVFQTIAGLCFALQFHIRPAAFGLVIFTLLASLMLLDFWRQTGALRHLAIRNWQSNLAITGALLVIGLH